MRKLIGLLTGAIIATLPVIFAAEAAPASFCRSYARAAVAQYEESRENGCDALGGRWQSSLDNHYNWCLGSSIDDVDEERDFREDSLRTCRRALPVRPVEPPPSRTRTCRAYAISAANQYETAETLNCGFRGGRWQSSEINHFNWCLGATDASVSRETQGRAEELAACQDIARSKKPPKLRNGITFEITLGGKPKPPRGPVVDFCRKYAVEAVRHNERQEWLGCDYFGNRWNANERAHFNWCTRSERTAVLREAGIRRSALKACEQGE
jgi:hypothetical protein